MKKVIKVFLILLILAFAGNFSPVFARKVQKIKVAIFPVDVPSQGASYTIYPNVLTLISNDLINELNKFSRLSIIDLDSSETIIKSNGLYKQYQKLLYRANIEVEYIYILDNWFKKPEYKDVLDYIISVGCQFYFEYIPLYKLGLPIPE